MLLAMCNCLQTVPARFEERSGVVCPSFFDSFFFDGPLLSPPLSLSSLYSLSPSLSPLILSLFLSFSLSLSLSHTHNEDLMP